MPPSHHSSLVRIAAYIAFVVAVTVAAGGCGSSQHVAPRPTTGGIAGLARDHDSGDPIANAEIHVRGGAERMATSSERGLYGIDQLPPGRYSLSASFAGQPVDVDNITVRAGETTIVDLVFTLGKPDPLKLDFGDTKGGAIDRYRPRNLPATSSIIEGTVSDTETRQRVAGAVVTAVDANAATQQTVSDENGRFRFDGIAPGRYAVSAYYSVGGRGQIEVRRSGIDVAGAEAVVVPLWIEMAR
jgi:carboxypeptidase family protein